MVGVCPTPYGGPGCPAPPWGAGADIRARSGPAVVAGSRLRHILIGIRSGPAPVWEGGGRRPHAGSGTTRRVLGAGRTVSEDGGSFVESGGEEGRVCPIRATRQGRGLRCGRRPVGSAALGLAGVSVRRGRTGRRVARMRGTPVGRGRCAKGGVDLHARDSEPVVRGWHTRPWSWLMAPHATCMGPRGHAWGVWEVASSRVRVIDGCGVR